MAPVLASYMYAEPMIALLSTVEQGTGKDTKYCPEPALVTVPRAMTPSIRTRRLVRSQS